MEYKWDILAKRLRELAYLNAGIRITLTDTRGANPHSETFHYEGGVAQFVDYLSASRNTLSPSVIFFQGETKNFRSDGSGDFFYDIAFQYNDSYDESIHSFVNGINTKDGGTHLTGFLTSLTRAINNYSKRMSEEAAAKKGKKAAPAKKTVAGKEVTVSSEDVRKGLSAVVSVKVENPLFESQTKTKLNNPEINGLVMSASYEHINNYFEEHPREAAAIVEHAIICATAREKSRQAIQDVLNPQKALVGLTGKLSDCSCKDPNLCELYIVEVTPQAVPPRAAAKAPSRPFCPSAASSSTPKRPLPTGCCATRKSAPSSPPSVRVPVIPSTLPRPAITAS